MHLGQPLVGGRKKYTGLLQTLRLVIAEEGAHSLCGGLSAHLMRVVPTLPRCTPSTKVSFGGVPHDDPYHYFIALHRA